jgi:Domain of unknown function DUF29
MPRNTRNAAAYEEDLYAWSAEQARLLREGRFAEIDAENIAEEIESLGRSDRRELQNRLAVLLAHLLKWQFQPQARSKSWRATIREQRRRIVQLTEESGSLKAKLPEIAPKAYAEAREVAVDETDLPIESFPEELPFPIEKVTAADFWPDGDDLPIPAKGARSRSK